MYHCQPCPEGALRFTRLCGGNTPPTHSPFITASPSQLKTKQAVGRQHSTHMQPLHYCFTQPAQNSTGCGTATLHPHAAPSLLLHPASSKLNRLWDGNTPPTHSPLTTACSHSASSKLNRLWDGNTPPTHSPLTTACSHSASSKLNRLQCGNTPSTHSPLHYCPLSPTPAAVLQASLLPSKPSVKKTPKISQPGKERTESNNF